MSYRVKTVSEQTGIPRNTLVAWERRYNLLDVRRSESGYRIYEDADIAYLKELKVLVDQGVAISEAISRVPRTQPKVEIESITSDPMLAVLEALIAFDHLAAAPHLRRIEQMPFLEALQEVWEPLLFEVGQRWERGEISIAQEHFVSEIAREAFAAMLRSIGHGRGVWPVVVCACMPGERHDLPLLSVSVQLALAGWRVIWLGADVPLPDLCAFVASHSPDVVCLSAIIEPPDRVLQVGRTVLSCAPRSTTVVLGGPSASPLRNKEGARLWVCNGAAELLTRWVHRMGTDTHLLPS
jgi:DNA-binding transcriptional MerR regulator